MGRRRRVCHGSCASYAYRRVWGRNSAVVALGANLDGRPQFVVNVTDDLIKQKLHAGQIIKQITALADGNGGGRPSQAMGGGKDVAKLGSAIDQTCAIVKAMIEG